MSGSKKFRDGRLSNEEKQFIIDNYGILTNTDIAAHINKNPDRIDGIIEKVLRENSIKELETEYDIKTRAFWKDIEKQFTKDELDSFIYHWGKMIEQFKHDVLHTEELQIVDAIKLEILMGRSLVKQKEMVESIERVRNQIENEKSMATPDWDKVAGWEKDIAFYIAAQNTIGKEYKDLQDQKNKMLSSLKGTRQQRVERLEQSKESFTGWLKEVYTNSEYSERLGLDMEKMRLAMYKELDRLSQYHQYADGKVDVPFLNADTVKDDM